MAKSKLVETNKKIEKEVVETYQNIEEGVVGTYKNIESSVVGAFNKMTDKFVDSYLTKDGETVEEAKERLAPEQKDREAKKLARQKRHEELVNKHKVK